MKTLRKEQVRQIIDYVESNSRKLEYQRLRYVFNQANPKEIADELRKYRNEDGGFGQGLEPDFQLPHSSPMATTVAFQIIKEINDDNSCADLIESGMAYFEGSFNSEDNRWYSVDKTVNDYPHAPWWNYDKELGMTIIDKHWGNQNAEIVGYLLKYSKYVKRLNIKDLLESALTNLSEKDDYDSEHEIYCYLRLYDELTIEQKQRFYPHLKQAIQKLVEVDASKWNKYVARPTDFVEDNKSDFYENLKLEVDKDLDYIVTVITENKVVTPTWEWGQYEADWETSKKHWIGVIAVKYLKIWFSEEFCGQPQAHKILALK